MKHLLTGVAMAAALAIAAPVWAQSAPATPGGNNPTSGAAGPLAPKPAPAPAPAAAPAPAPAKAAAAKPAAKKPMAAKPAAAKPAAAKPMMHHAMHHRAMSQGDQMTEQLNAQELQRIMGGAPAPAAPGYGGNNPTSGAAGPFAPAGAAPPPPAQK